MHSRHDSTVYRISALSVAEQQHSQQEPRLPRQRSTDRSITVKRFWLLCVASALIGSRASPGQTQQKAPPATRAYGLVDRVKASIQLGTAYAKELARTAKAIHGLRCESLDDAISSLTEETSYPHLLAVIRRKKFSPHGACAMEVVVGSRRFSRTAELIASLDEDTRVQAAHRAVAETLKVYQAAMGRAITGWKDPAAPRNTQSLLGCQYGMSAALLLAARFGRLSVLCRDIRRALSFADATARAIRRDLPENKLAAIWFDQYRPDAQVAGNAIVMAFSRAMEAQSGLQTGREDGGPDVRTSARLSELRGLLADLPQRRVPMFAWDAPLIPTDRLHLIDRLKAARPIEELVIYGPMATETVEKLLQLASATVASGE